MTTPVLVTYASEHGSTREVAAAIAARLRETGLDCELQPAIEVTDLGPYCGVILGGAIYVGRLHPEAVGFLHRHHAALAVLPIAVFALGPRTLEPLDLASSRKQLQRALEKAPDIDPYEIAVFGGVIDPTTLRFPLNHLHASDARDWDDIDAFALRCAQAYDYGKAAAELGDPRTEVPQTHR
ncbi:MAG TPA: flavodoxin domain-containing protein [Gaiellaceae bacterium]|jgi:menaquinone-dependent protoporphyrinogen oxidase